MVWQWCDFVKWKDWRLFKYDLSVLIKTGTGKLVCKKSLSYERLQPFLGMHLCVKMWRRQSLVWQRKICKWLLPLPTVVFLYGIVCLRKNSSYGGKLSDQALNNHYICGSFSEPASVPQVTWVSKESSRSVCLHFDLQYLHRKWGRSPVLRLKGVNMAKRNWVLLCINALVVRKSLTSVFFS